MEASTEAGRLRVSVHDTGIGIDTRQQQTLFQRFETLVHNNILQPSSGIGLSLVKELVELHQGTIHVESRPGAGSTFSIDLPLTPQDYEGKENAEFILADSNGNTAPAKADTTDGIAEEEEQKVTAEHEAREQYSVLVVEDNDELRNFVADILRDTYRVLTATNGREGLQKALSTQPDFILSGVMMPEMDGLDMVRAIKENPESSHIPIILLSAKSSLDDRIKGIEQGIDDYITKPFSSTYLKARIKTLLTQRHQLQQRYETVDRAHAAAAGSRQPRRTTGRQRCRPTDTANARRAADYAPRRAVYAKGNESDGAADGQCRLHHRRVCPPAQHGPIRILPEAEVHRRTEPSGLCARHPHQARAPADRERTV